MQVPESENMGNGPAGQVTWGAPATLLALCLKALGEAELVLGKCIWGAHFRAVYSEGSGRAAFLRMAVLRPQAIENLCDYQPLEAMELYWKVKEETGDLDQSS